MMTNLVMKPLKPAPLWDIPIRLCHGLFIILVAIAFLSEQLNHMIWHRYAGIALMGVLSFRLTWGFIGTHHARFSHFWPTPRKIARYLQGQWQQQGHNPLGALSVLTLLSLLILQVSTGLVSSDDSGFSGPLAPLIDSTFSERLTRIHRLLKYGLLAIIALHISAIIFYQRVKKQNLLQPMLTGGQSQTIQAAPAWWAYLLALTIAGLSMVVASGLWLTPHTTTTTPSVPATPNF